MGQPKYDKVAIEDYLAIEQEDNIRYEYHEGEIFAMAGGSISHSRICGNCYGVLRDITKETGKCEPFTSELKVEVKCASRYLYPDAGIACPEFNESDTISGAIDNPKLIIEVASESSEGYDRGDKLKYYFSIPSLHEYIVINQDKADVVIWRRRGDLFRFDTYEGLDAVVPLESIEGALPLKEIYKNVKFPPPKKRDLNHVQK